MNVVSAEKGNDRFAETQYATHRLWTQDEWERMNNWTREIYNGRKHAAASLALTKRFYLVSSVHNSLYSIDRIDFLVSWSANLQRCGDVQIGHVKV